MSGVSTRRNQRDSISTPGRPTPPLNSQTSELLGPFSQDPSLPPTPSPRPSMNPPKERSSAKRPAPVNGELNSSIKKLKAQSLDELISNTNPDVDLSDINNIPSDTIQFMHSAKNKNDWLGRCRSVVNQIFWVKRVVQAKERNAIFEHLLPVHIHTGSDRKVCKSYFDSAMAYSLADLRSRIEELGNLWIASDAGQAYIDVCKAEDAIAKKKGKGPGKFSNKPQVAPPSTPHDMLTFMEKTGLQITKYHLIEVCRRWLMFLETEDAPEGSIGWLSPTKAEEETGTETFHLTNMANAILGTTVVYVRAEALFPGSLVTRNVTKSLQAEHYHIPSVDHWPRIRNERSDYSSQFGLPISLPDAYAGPANIPDDVHEYNQTSLHRTPDTEGDDGTEPEGGEGQQGLRLAPLSLSSNPLVPKFTPPPVDAFKESFQDDDTYMHDNEEVISDLIEEAANLRTSVDDRILDELNRDGICHDFKIHISRKPPKSITEPYMTEFAARLASLDPLAQGALTLHAIEHRQVVIGAESFRLEAESHELHQIKEKLEQALDTAYSMRKYCESLKKKVEDQKRTVEDIRVETERVRSSKSNFGSAGSYFSKTQNQQNKYNFAAYNAFQRANEAQETSPSDTASDKTVHSPREGETGVGFGGGVKGSNGVVSETKAFGSIE